MIIEFAGIAGAGKTTVFQKLTKALHANDVPVVRFHKAAKESGLPQEKADRAFDENYPGLQARMEALAGPQSYELAHAPAARRVWMAGLNTLGANDIGMVDEGFLHRCAYLAASGPDRKAWLDILPKLPRTSCVVFVDLPLEEARARYIWRMPNKERRAVAAKRYDRRLSDHRNVAELLQEGLKAYKQRGILTHVIDNRDCIEDQLTDLLRTILEKYSKTRVAA